MYNKQQITKYLTRNLGLSGLESQIYLDLLEHGTSTVLKIAERTEIKRPTVHRNIDELIKKGLTTQIKVGQGNTRKITAEPPQKLKTILSQKKFELKEAEEELPNITTAIHSLIPGSEKNTAAEVRYYEGIKNIKTLYNEILGSSEIHAYVDPLLIEKYLPENVGLFIESMRKQPKQKIWEILYATPQILDYTSQMPKDRYLYKFAPELNRASKIDYLLYDGRIAIINLSEDPNATVLINEGFYESAKLLFNVVWNSIVGK